MIKKILTNFQIFSNNNLLIFLTIFPTINWAGDTIDYNVWNNQARYAERQIEVRDVSESLRKQIADWRLVFQKAADVNKTKIATIEAQIDALGKTPKEGEKDPLKDRRIELYTKLMELKTPVNIAMEALQKAEGLIKEIDEIIRARQKSNLVHLGKTPLAIFYWPSAVKELINFHRQIIREIMGNLSSENRVREIKNNSLSILTHISISLLLLFGAPVIVRRIYSVFSAGRITNTRLVNFLFSFAITFVRISGLSYFISVIADSGVFELRGILILNAAFDDNFNNLLQNWPLWLFGTLWLSQQLFFGKVKKSEVKEQKNFTRESWTVGLLIGTLILNNYLNVIAEFSSISEYSYTIWNFLPILLTSLLLFQFGNLNLEVLIHKSEDERTPTSLNWNILAFLKRLVKIISILTPIFAAIGFVNAANALLFSSIQSIILIGVVMMLQIFANDLYSVLMGKNEEENDALIPILISFLLILLALPFFSLIWGARVVDLQEIWVAFQRGVPVGETRISPINLLYFFVVFTVGYMATRILQSALKSTILPKTSLEAGAQTAVLSGIGYIGIFVAALISISTAGLDLSSLAIVAGALSVGIGFGLQTIVSNFVSGIILLIERPVSEGDWIEVGGKMGYVKNISVRSTRIETFDRTDVIIPNADLVSGTVTNYTRGNTIGRVIVPVGVAYGTNTKFVEKILKEIILEHPMVLNEPAPSVVFKGFGADSLDFEIRAILKDINWILNVKSEINHAIAEKFKLEGIEIPFAQRDLWLRNPEILRRQKDQNDPK